MPSVGLDVAPTDMSNGILREATILHTPLAEALDRLQIVVAGLDAQALSVTEVGEVVAVVVKVKSWLVAKFPAASRDLTR